MTGDPPSRPVADLWDAGPGYLDTATYGLPPRPGFQALESALADWRGGTGSWEGWASAVQTARESFARLVDADAEDVFTCAATSEVAGIVAAGLPDGAEVLVPQQEFTSIVFPWAVHERRGVRVREVPLAGLAEAVGPDTALVAVSLVQSSDGAVADLDPVTAAARRHGALVFLDVTHAAGWLPVDLAGVDAAACSAYKWLMCPRGTAFGIFSPALRDSLVPLFASWFAGDDVHGSYYGLPAHLAATARRFDASPAWHCWVGAAATLQAVEGIGVAAIHDHDVGLANLCRERLGLPPGPGAIVRVEAPEAAGRLARAGIRAAVRAGAVRLSFHAYNTAADVEAAASALREG